MIIHVPSLPSSTSNRRTAPLTPPGTPHQLHSYIRRVLGFDLPRRSLMPGHHAPFEYLKHSFFETSGPRDCIVWANRGGGKTQIGAIATLLDLIFKPGIQIRILGGSFEQSSKMYRYLKRMLENRAFSELIAGNLTGRFVELTNGSRVEVLSQSERAVRGQRVHKLRCDEIELFGSDVWEAAQLVTRSGRCGDVYVRAAIESLSTMHKPFGLMQKLVRQSAAANRRVFCWSLLDTLRHCPPSRSCDGCQLWDECHGRAKRRHARGFFDIDDAIQQKHRVGLQTWQAEMLCEQPSRADTVYPEFNPKAHVFDGPVDGFDGGELITDGRQTCIGGIDFGYRSPTVLLWAILGHDDVISIVDELSHTEHTTEKFIELANAKCTPGSGSGSGIGSGSGSGDGGGSGGGIRGSGGSRGSGGRGGRRPDWVGADPAGHQRNEHTGVSTISLWKKAGWSMRTCTLPVAVGIKAVRRRLLRADGTIGLRIHRRCERLIEALSMYHYPVDEPESVMPVKEGHDHAADALRYMIVNLDRAAAQVRVRGY